MIDLSKPCTCTGPSAGPMSTCPRHRVAIVGDATVKAEGKEAERRRHLLARMAGNIAAGFTTGATSAAWSRGEKIAPALPGDIAAASIAIARAILAEVEREPAP